MEADSDFTAVKQDLAQAFRRSKEKKYLECKDEAANYIYPIIQSFLEAADARFLEIEAVLAEQADPTESVLLPEFTDRIAMVLAVGGRIAMACQIILEKAQLDDATKKQLSDLLENKGELKDWIATYHVDAQALIEELQDVTVEEYDEDEDGEEEEVEDAELVEGDEEEEEGEEE